MNRERTVQIPESLFWNLCRYHFYDEINPESSDVARYKDLTFIEDDIINGLADKLEAMEKRAAYSAYKDTSATPEAREAARQRYLNLVGMLPGYRWSSLEPPV